MAYEKPITIREAIAAIAAIEDGEYVLPSIQREFVWDTIRGGDRASAEAGGGVGG